MGGDGVGYRWPRELSAAEWMRSWMGAELEST
jgi:hypothetical protein